MPAKHRPRSPPPTSTATASLTSSSPTTTKTPSRSFFNTTTTGASTPSFAAQQSFATGEHPSPANAADLNGDGVPDLVVADEGSDSASVLLNTIAPGASTPSFAAQQSFAAGDAPSAVASRFDLVRARSVPRQDPPYRSLTEVVADQQVFELAEIEGTMLGFRFPAYVEGIEVGGYHLHFISAGRSRGGHVLDSRSRGLRARLDPSDDLHVELPPRIDLEDPALAAQTHAAVELVERSQR
jgi:acetolactate decarboxylase